MFNIYKSAGPWRNIHHQYHYSKPDCYNIKLQSVSPGTYYSGVCPSVCLSVTLFWHFFFYFLEVKWRPRKLSCVESSRKCGAWAPHFWRTTRGGAPRVKEKQTNNLVSTCSLRISWVQAGIIVASVRRDVFLAHFIYLFSLWFVFFARRGAEPLAWRKREENNLVSTTRSPYYQYEEALFFKSFTFSFTYLY
jgi:hypothetical protein